MKNKGICIIAVTVILLTFITPEAHADMYTFENLWRMVSGDPGPTVGDQLSVAVASAGETWGSGETWEYDVQAGEVLFIFENSGPIVSSIADIYFDDGSLVLPMSILNTTTNLSDPAIPGVFPGGSSIDPTFVTTSGFSAGGNFKDGIQNGESAGIVFKLESGKTFDDVISAMYAGFDLRAGDDATGTLRIGIHVQGIGGEDLGYSQEYLFVPVPAAAILGILGLSVAGIKLRKYT